MKKSLLSAITVISSLAFSHSALAGEGLSKEMILSTAQGYILSHDQYPKPRRSELTAFVLESFKANDSQAQHKKDYTEQSATL